VSDKVQAIRGMDDILPGKVHAWQEFSSRITSVMDRYGYHEIRTPMLEALALFKRSIGDVTDIVEKEMYAFQDMNGDYLALRPEGTASTVRACIEHGLLHNQTQKLWYLGSMFRHEKPQKGRLRQFHQLGIEAFGFANSHIELEVILLCQKIFQAYNLEQHLMLEINTLGDAAERLSYKKALVDYLTPHINNFTAEIAQRLHKNPLRLLDSKNIDLQELLIKAPLLLDSLSKASRLRFDTLCQALNDYNISYTINHKLVRGLDYYSHTVFEFTTDMLGAQATICAGGRYDSLIAHLGGDDNYAFGAALGIERLLLLQESLGNTLEAENPDIYCIASGDAAWSTMLAITENLRSKSAWRIILSYADTGFKSQFKKADKSGAKIALILGDDELKSQSIGVKNLRSLSEQKNILQAELYDYILSAVNGT
jgi:histidyl-tRNA synthetase